jgi:hypothetical protein
VTANIAQAETVFATIIVTSGANYGNVSDPSVPAEFEGVIAGIQGLDNMHAVMPAGLHRRLPAAGELSPQGPTLALADMAQPGAGEGDASVPGATVNGGTAFGPFDVETYYNESPLIAAGNLGTASPDCIALDEDSDYLDAAVSLFTSTFGFTPFNITRVGTSPGRMEMRQALLDITTHATAPGTPIRFYMNSSLYTSIRTALPTTPAAQSASASSTAVLRRRSSPVSIRCSRKRQARASPCLSLRATGARQACSTNRAPV